MRRTRPLIAGLLSLTAAMIVPATQASADGGYCDVQCQWDLQLQNGLPRTDFYEPPSPLRRAPAGTVIRHEDTTDYEVDGSTLAATRVLYHSRTSAGRDVAASGIILVPQGPPPEGGWPVVVDAHGASGIARDCAPSLMRDLYHGNQMMRFVEQGYAVVAPDYAGLGTDGRHELVNKTAEANDVIAAVRAAHEVRADLSPEWVLWGHSQGGGAALAVAERQRLAPLDGYLGAVVTSPASDLPELARHVATSPGYGAFAALLAAGANNSDPKVPVERILSPEAFSRVGIADSGCLGVASAAYADLTGDALVTKAYWNDPHFNRYLRENSTGGLPVGGPVLLLQGEADTVTPRAVTDEVAASLCELGARLDYRTYPGLEHDTYPWMVGIDDGAMPDILAWTADRFAGMPAHSTC